MTDTTESAPDRGSGEGKTSPGTWLATIVTIGLFVWILAALSRGPQGLNAFGATEQGELVVLRVNTETHFRNKPPRYQYDVKLVSDGTTGQAWTNMLLSKGEHLNATYARDLQGTAIRLDVYTRCGMVPCSVR